MRSISLSVAPGRVLAVCGKNGAGKSTLMKMLSEATRPDSEEILIDGQPARIAQPSDAMRLGIRTVQQELNLLPHQSVAENMLLGHMPTRGLGFVVDWPTVTEMAGKVLVDFRFPAIDPRTLVRDLSLARQQKVVIAKWLLVEHTKVFILDEPTRGVDIASEVEICQMMAELASGGVAVLLISSETPGVLGLSGRLLIMREGRVVAELLPDGF